MPELGFDVDGLPPAKSEARSMLAAGHEHSTRVTALLRAARDALDGAPPPLFGIDPVGLDVVLTAAVAPPSDATNYLGGIGDVLEVKDHRGALEHLGELARVAVYHNDKQIHEVHFRWQQGTPTGYRIRIWAL